MKPVSPVVPGQPEVIYAKDQPEYLPLPAHRSADGCVTSRWRLTWKERLRVSLKGDIYLQLLTFNMPLQPVMLFATVPEELQVERQPTALEMAMAKAIKHWPDGRRG